ncbi:MAG TPA: F0F1 ATP synthase subunit delta [Candidatus Paceibacterota bacterium]|jgi:F-type H+-transporting ATPase subunit delta|nr:F0F1 ATP synthase subunit delta [Candidatus Paceibacterota bacterium]
MPIISINNLAQAIYDSSKGKTGEDLDALMENAACLLAEKHMLGKSNLILDKLENIIDEDNGIVRARVSTRTKTDKKITDAVEELLKKRYKAKEIIPTYIEDKKLLGGIKIEVGDEVIDMTLSNKIGQLQNYLNTN